MNDNYLMLDGKKFPMDEETEQLLRGQYKKLHVPVVRIASFETDSSYDRIIIRLSRPAKELFDDLESDVIVIDRHGDVTNHWLTSDESNHDMWQIDVYSNIQTLIEGNLP